MVRNVLSFALCFMILFGIPSLSLVHADIGEVLDKGIVPCGNSGPTGTLYKDTNGVLSATGTEATDCQYSDVIKLIQNLLDIMFYIAILVTVYLLMVTGFKYLTAGSKGGQLEAAKKSFATIGWGFLLMLSAYLIINLLVTVLLDTTPDLQTGVQYKNPLSN